MKSKISLVINQSGKFACQLTGLWMVNCRHNVHVHRMPKTATTMPRVKKTTEVVSEGTVATPQRVLTTAEAKRQKTERLRARHAKYVLEPRDYRARAIEPVVKQASKLFLLAYALGQAKNSQDANADKTAEAIGKKFAEFKDRHLSKIRNLGTYYSVVYRVAGKRAENVAKGVVRKPRDSVMPRSVSKFQPALYNFIRAAAQTNESLKPALECSTFNTESELNGYMSSTYAAQFILAYVARNRRFNSENGQYIQPDDLMKKHLGAGIDKVLASVRASAEGQKDPKKRDAEREKMRRFPDQFTFCRLQELIGFYRVKPAEGSAELAARDALRQNEEHWPTLRAEFEAMSKVREHAYDQLHAENPKPVKEAGKKGPRGPLSEAQKQARKIKKEGKALAEIMELELVEKKKSAVPAEPVATA